MVRFLVLVSENDFDNLKRYLVMVFRFEFMVRDSLIETAEKNLTKTGGFPDEIGRSEEKPDGVSSGR